MEKEIIKKVTIADLAVIGAAKGKGKARKVRRPLMREIRVDQKRVTKSIKEAKKAARKVEGVF